MNLTPAAELVLNDGLLLIGIYAVIHAIKWFLKPGPNAKAAINDARGPFSPCRSYDPSLDEEAEHTIHV